MARFAKTVDHALKTVLLEKISVFALQDLMDLTVPLEVSLLGHR